MMMNLARYAGTSPNQRARRVEANVFLSGAKSSDGPTISPVGEGPPRLHEVDVPVGLAP